MTDHREAVAAISTPEVVNTRLGTLTFRDGMPDAENSEKVFDHLDLSHGVNAFLAGLPGVSLRAMRRGFLDNGIADGDVLIFSGLMDSQSLFLTANADTVYFITFLDLSNGPLVLQAPPDCLGAVNDMWFRWVSDIGVSGPARGTAATYVLLPPGYDGPAPEGGAYVVHCPTTHIILFGRNFLVDNDPAPAVAQIKETLRISPYVPGGVGTSMSSFLLGKAPLAPVKPVDPPVFVEGTGLVINTIPPNDFSFYELLDTLIQEEPASAPDPEGAGSFRAIGIAKGQKFQPDQRMRAILDEAVAIANATARNLGLRARPEEGFEFYENSAWFIPMWLGWYDWNVPPPEITPSGVKPYPATTGRTLNARTSFFYVYTAVTPAMCMRLTGVGSQYLTATLDSQGKPFDGDRAYRMTLPAGIPAARFWSMTLYDNQTRSMLQTPQRFPRAGSQSCPTPAAIADADGTTTLHFAPTRPEGVAEGNWIQTAPGKGWFCILRLYSPEQPFFDRSWRPTEIDPAN